MQKISKNINNKQSQPLKKHLFVLERTETMSNETQSAHILMMNAMY